MPRVSARMKRRITLTELKDPKIEQKDIWGILHAQLLDLKARVDAGCRVYSDALNMTISRVEFNPVDEEWRVVSWDKHDEMDEQYVCRESPEITHRNFSTFLESLTYSYAIPNQALAVRDRVAKLPENRPEVRDLFEQVIPQAVKPGSAEDILVNVLEVGPYNQVDSEFDSVLIPNECELSDVCSRIAEHWSDALSAQDIEAGCSLTIEVKQRKVRASEYFNNEDER